MERTEAMMMKKFINDPDNLVNEVNSDTFDKRKKLGRRWQQQEAILAENAREILFETTWWPDDISGIVLNPDGKFDYSKIHRKPCVKFIQTPGTLSSAAPLEMRKASRSFRKR